MALVEMSKLAVRAHDRALACTAALVAVLLAPRGAGAFVHGVNREGEPLSWSTSCETVNIYLNGFTEMTPDEVAKSIGAAAAAWGPDGVTCPASTGDGGSGHPYLEIMTAFASGGSAPVPANDGNNTIAFQTTTDGWNSLDVPSNALAYADVKRQPSGPSAPRPSKPRPSCGSSSTPASSPSASSRAPSRRQIRRVAAPDNRPAQAIPPPPADPTPRPMIAVVLGEPHPIRFVCAREGDDLSSASEVSQVDFIRATTLSWNAAKPMRVRQADGRHIRWTIWAVEAAQVDDGYKVRLRGSGPEVEIECEDIDVTSLEARSVAILNRSWFEPGQPFARPGIEVLSAKLVGPHNPRRRG